MNVPRALVLVLALIAAVGAWYLPMAKTGPTFTLAHWAPWDGWSVAFAFRWDFPAALGLVGVGALGALWVGVVPGIGQKGSLQVFAIALLSALLGTMGLVSEGVWFLALFGWAVVAGFVALELGSGLGVHPRLRGPSPGVVASLGGWLVALVVSHELFRDSDWHAMARLINEPYEFDPSLLRLAWIAAFFGAASLASAPLIGIRKNQQPSPLEQWWLGVFVPVSVGLAVSRFGFLAGPAAALGTDLLGVSAVASAGLVLFTLALGMGPVRSRCTERWGHVVTMRLWAGVESAACAWLVLLVGLAVAVDYALAAAMGLSLSYCLSRPGLIASGPPWLRRAYPLVAMLAVAAVVPGLARVNEIVSVNWPPGVVALLGVWSASRLLLLLPMEHGDLSEHPRVGSLAPRMAWLDAEHGFWHAVWKLPISFGLAAGYFTQYWARGTTQYGLMATLLGTLALLWAVLKTQVVW